MGFAIRPWMLLTAKSVRSLLWPRKGRCRKPAAFAMIKNAAAVEIDCVKYEDVRISGLSAAADVFINLAVLNRADVPQIFRRGNNSPGLP